MQIEYLKHSQIDKHKWDFCIRNSVNGSVYAWSWYLDAVCEGWEALVSADYKTIMPLTARRKFGISYLFRPLLNQQLGVFSEETPTKDTVEKFLNAIPKKYRLIEINLNKYNSFELPELNMKLHACYELDLISDYESVRNRYNQNTRRSIKKAEQFGLIEDPNVSAKEFFELMLQDKSKGSEILREPGNILHLNNLLESLKKYESGRITGIRNSENILITACLFAKSHQKWFYLAPVNTNEGKDKRAMFLLIDKLIQESANQSLTLDFEGSDIPGVARFYAGFGALPYSYPAIRRNTLPFPIKYLKG